VQRDPGVLGQPGPHVWVGVGAVVVAHDVQLGARVRRRDLAQEFAELLVPVTGVAGVGDLAGGDLQGGEQRGGSVPDVVMAALFGYPRPQRRSPLPKGISQADAQALLASCDLRHPVGRRDYAVLVTLLRLGLRASEASALTLEDIDWRAGEITVHGKGLASLLCDRGNMAEAEQWCRRAADKGDPDAVSLLADILKRRDVAAQVRRLRTRRPIVPVALMIPLIPLFVFVSFASLQIAHSSTRRVFNMNELAFIWISLPLLLFLVIRPLNVFALWFAGARPPTSDEARYLQPMLQQVLRRAGIRPDRYDLRIVSHRWLPIDRDLGPYVVTVDEKDIRELTPEHLSAVVAQRVSRQLTLLAPLLSICLWALLPLAFILGVGILAMIILRVLYRTMFKAVDEAGPPPTEAAAGCALLLIGVGLAGLIAFILIGAIILWPLAGALIAIAIVAGIARWADRQSDSVAITLGYGLDLAGALTRLNAIDVPTQGWRRLLSTHAEPGERLRRVQTTPLSVDAV
jgi:Phage integrase family